jgi:osmotically-inducible protein OsmY
MERKGDETLRIEVENELAWDTQTCNLGLKVGVTDGVATIIGFAPSYAAKESAQTAAHRVAGVMDVANEIVVNPPREHSDEEIAHVIRKAFEWNSTLPEERIISSVSNGGVTLEGDVDFLWQRDKAEEVVKTIAGVQKVTNLLVVNVAEAITLDIEKLRSIIENALERRADREARSLRIKAEDGEVSLYGRVNSWQERRAVVGAISHAPGVKRVNDNLRIDPYF